MTVSGSEASPVESAASGAPDQPESHAAGGGIVDTSPARECWQPTTTAAPPASIDGGACASSSIWLNSSSPLPPASSSSSAYPVAPPAAGPGPRPRVFVRQHPRSARERQEAADRLAYEHEHIRYDTTHRRVTVRRPSPPIDTPTPAVAAGVSTGADGASSTAASGVAFSASSSVGGSPPHDLILQVDGLSLPALPTGILLKRLQDRVAHARTILAAHHDGTTPPPPHPHPHQHPTSRVHFDHLPSVLVTVVCHFLDVSDLQYFIATNRHARDAGLLPHSWKFIPPTPSERVYRTAIQPFMAGLLGGGEGAGPGAGVACESAAVLSCGSSDVHVRRQGEFFHHPKFHDADADADSVAKESCLVLRAAEDLFHRVDQRQAWEAEAGVDPAERTEFVVRMTFLCICQERLLDLTDWRERVPLSIKQNADGVFLPSLKPPQVVHSPTEVEEMLRQAVLGARRWETAMDTSLSTASKITSFHIAQRRRRRPAGFGGGPAATAAAYETIHQSSLHLVDARAGFRAREGIHPTQPSSSSSSSFSSSPPPHIRTIPIDLHNVVTAQSSASWKFVPWRDGKFTRLLQKYIGECARVALLVNIAPLETSPQTIVELMQFAARFRQMKPKDTATPTMRRHQPQRLLPWMIPPPTKDEWTRAAATMAAWATPTPNQPRQ